MGTLKKSRMLRHVLTVLPTLIGGKVSVQYVEYEITELWQEFYVYKDLNEKWSGSIL